MGKRPDMKVQIKSKTSGATMDLLLGWENDDGRIGMVMSKDVASIKLEDGRVITPDACYFNFYDNREDTPAPPQRRVEDSTEGAPF